MNITITDPLRLAGIAAARAAYNDANPDVKDADGNVTEVRQIATDEAYMQHVVDGACDSYVASNEVGWIPSAEFVLRFTPQEIGAIKAAAQVSPAVADYLAQVNAAPKVRVVSTLVQGGIDALIAAGLVAPDRRAALLAY